MSSHGAFEQSKHALRSLFSAPSRTATLIAILTLGLALGTTTAVYELSRVRWTAS